MARPLTFEPGRVLGCLLFGALGDAIGGGPERKQICLSDDTQLTLATCEAVDGLGNVAPERVAASFLAWFRAGRLTGLGSATLKALRDLDAGAHWALAGARGERAAGNGAAMRVAPLAFALDPTDRVQRQTLRDCCRITHASDEAYAGALAVAIAIQIAAARDERTPRSPGGAGGGAPLPNAARTSTVVSASALADLLPDSRTRDILLAYGELGPDASVLDAAERFGCSGFVAETVPLAIFAARRAVEGPGAFQETLGQIVETGGDADTISAIAGNLTGAALGDSALPEKLAERLPAPELELVRSTAQTLVSRLDGARRGVG